MSITLSALQKQRRDTAANWTSANPTLLAGEIGIESDTGYWKAGDGSTVWNSLAYLSGLGGEIPVSRLADGSARQLLQTAANGNDVEWTSNVDIPGTLDVTSTATFDSISQHPLGAAATPSITFTGDTNTGIYSPGADQLAVTTGGTGRLFIDSSGRLLAGTSTARSNFFGTTLSSVTQIEGTGGAAGRGALSVINNDVSNNPPYVLLGRSGAATLGSNAAVVSGSRLGTLTFHGADGTSFIEAATVAGEVDGTPGTNDMPGRLVFSTTSDGAASPTERMRITSAGLMGIGTASPAVTLDVSATDAVRVAAGTTGQRPTGAAGMIRYNSTLGQFEGYGAAWGTIGGGAKGGGSDDIFYENGQTVTTNYTLTTNKNAMTAGPVSIDSGVTVTIPSGSSWVVV